MTTTPAPDVHAALRLEVGLLRARERHERFDTTLLLGTPGGGRHARVLPAEDLPLMDVGTRTDLVGLLLDSGSGRTGRASLWLARPGSPTTEDGDLAWLAAAVIATAARGQQLDRFWVVTRTGWLDVRTGESRTWRRLRL